MKHTVVKYGIYAMLSGFLLFGLPFFFGMGIENEYNQFLGYSSIVLSLLFIFFGVKHYRDKVNNGNVFFGQAIEISMLIALFSAVGVAIFDYIYTTQINPDFSTGYLEYSIKKMEATLPAEESSIKGAELKQQMEDYGGSGFMAALMFVTVVVIGFIISLISGLILQRKN